MNPVSFSQSCQHRGKVLTLLSSKSLQSARATAAPKITRVHGDDGGERLTDRAPTLTSPDGNTGRGNQYLTDLQAQSGMGWRSYPGPGLSSTLNVQLSQPYK